MYPLFHDGVGGEKHGKCSREGAGRDTVDAEGSVYMPGTSACNDRCLCNSWLLVLVCLICFPL